MNTIDLKFHAIEDKPHNFILDVNAYSLGQISVGVKLPFLDGKAPNIVDRRLAIVKVLESTQFNKGSFTDENERTWMKDTGILCSEEDEFETGYLANIGSKLYEVLGHSAQNLIERSVAKVKENDIWLHIRLIFFSDTLKIIRLPDYPWELLRNSYDFLARQKVVFSRYIAYSSPTPKLPPVQHLNVLLISSRASDESNNLKSLPTGELDALAQQLQQSQNADQELIQLETLTPATWDALEARLRQPRKQAVTHIIHFDGHGFFGKRCNKLGCGKAYNQTKTHCTCDPQQPEPLGGAQGYLLFEQSDGSPHYVSAEELGKLFGDEAQQGVAFVVVLSACRSALSLLDENFFNGVTQKLIGQGIPAVVGMTYTVSVDAAKAFALGFYKSLQLKQPLPIALQKGQDKMMIAGKEWYRPVLYLRCQEDNKEGRLFSNSPKQQEKEDNTQDLLKKLRKLNEPKKEIDRNIQRAYIACSAGKDWSYIKTDDIEKILKDVENIPQGNLQYPRVDYFVVCLVAYLTNSKLNVGELAKWAEKNINGFSEKLAEEIINIEQKEKKKNSSLMIEIAKSTHKSILSKNKESYYYTAKAWFIEDIESYQYKDAFGCEQINLSEFNERDFIIEDIDKVLNKCINKINDYDWLNLIIEIFLPLDVLNHPVYRCKLQIEWADNNLIGQNYRVVVRSYERAQRNFLKPNINKWQSKWKALKNLSRTSVGSAFILGDENNVDNLNTDELQKQDIIGLKVVKQPKNIKDIFTLILQTGIPVALWLEKNPLDLEECQSEIEQILSCCIYDLPENVRRKREEAKQNFDTHIGHNLSLLWDDPCRLLPRIDYHS